MAQRIRKHRKGHVIIDLEDHERQILVELVDQLRTLLMSGTEPSLRRLFPTAYPDDARHESDYQKLVHGALLEHRLATLEAFEATVHQETITVEEANTWAAAINDLRLVLGTLLDVSESDLEFDPDGEQAYSHAVYHFLGALLEMTIEVLMGTLDSPTR